MTDDLGATLAHLEALVAFDTRNPPRLIDAGPDGIFGYIRRALGQAFTFQSWDLGQGCHSLLATRGQPRWLINVHLDTVPAAEGWSQDPLQLRVHGERAVGLGACDIKGAAACMLAAAAQTTGDVALLFTSDEEAGSSVCVRDFVQRFGPESFEAALVAEPTLGRAVVAHRGIATCRGTFSGVPGHASSRRALDDSALHDAARWASAALEQARRWEQASYRELSGVRFNLGHLEGGTKPNMIAGQAQVWWGTRPLPNQDPEEVVARLQSYAPHPSRVQWHKGFRGPSLPASDDADGSASAQALAVASSLGLEPGAAVDFWTEASLFSQAGYTALVFGPGDIAQAHTAGEWVALEQLAQVQQAYQRIMGGTT